MCLWQNGRFDPALVTEEVAMHLVTVENDYRLLETTQDYYRTMEDQFDVESIIQSMILEHHCGNETNGSTRGPWISTKEDLADYRRAISQYTHLPHIRQKAFFLRNNIMVEGAPIGTKIPRDMPFVQLVDSPTTCSTITTMSTNLGYWMDQAASLHKTLIIFSGSLTWYSTPSHHTIHQNQTILSTYLFNLYPLNPPFPLNLP